MPRPHFIMPVLSLLFLTTPAYADMCRVVVSDGYLGVDTQGTPNSLGVQARVKTFANDGYLAALGGKAISSVTVDFDVIFQGETTPYYLGSAATNDRGWAFLDLHGRYGSDASGYYLTVKDGSTQYRHRLESSQMVQVTAYTPDAVSECDGGDVLPDVYGSLYFRHPDDGSPILFSDFDDTLFNSSDVPDVLRIIASGHYQTIDDEAVGATQDFRAAGGVFIGITAQPSTLRPFTRSELLRFDFDAAYSDQAYYYDDAGYDGSYLARSLTYLANTEYPGRIVGSTYTLGHCDYKIDKFQQLIDGIFGGNWQDVVGMIGDSEDSDGCAARAVGIHWYALMEGKDRVQDTSDPASYTEITGGWSEALPIVCSDADLNCG